MTTEEFKHRLEALLSEAADEANTYSNHLHMIGVLEYYCFAFKLGHAKACEKRNLEAAEGGEKEFGA